VLQPRRAHRAELGRVDARAHVGNLELDRLELRDGASELLALLRILDGRVARRARDADGLRRDADASAVERVHRDREALADLAEDVRLRHAAVLEHQLARGGRADAELLLLLADVEAGVRPLDEERRDAARLLARL